MMVGWRSRCIVARVRLHPIRGAEQIIAMPAVQRRWTAREVRELIADSPLQSPRYELVDGELLVTPSPTSRHQLAVSLLWKHLYEYLIRNPIGRALTSPLDVELEPNSLTQPDVVVVSLEEWQRIGREMPVRSLFLASEVLSPSSGQHDRVRKKPYYLRHMSQYWIIDLDARLVERWTPNDDRPEILVDVLEWHPVGAAETFRLDLPPYFAEILES
jgi:Uma2 family endonuclease